MAEKKPSPAEEKQLLAARYLRARKRGRKAYDDADGALSRLAQICKHGDEIDAGGVTLVFTDQFADKLKVFRPMPMVRFELAEKKQSRSE